MGHDNQKIFVFCFFIAAAGFGSMDLGYSAPMSQVPSTLEPAALPDRSMLLTHDDVEIVDSPLCPTFGRSHNAVIIVPSGKVKSLMVAVKSAEPGTTILLEDGVYKLSDRQRLAVNSPHVTIRGASGNREQVRLEGGSSTFVVNADQVTIADLTMTGPKFHHIQIRGERGVSGVRIYNVHLLDAGQQFIKVSAGDGMEHRFGDHGLVACSCMEYTTFSKGNGVTSPTYTNGVDILAGKGWVIRDNVFRRIRSEKGPAGPAILAWRNAKDTIIKRNVIVDSWRGIALGLSSPGKRSRGGVEAIYDHQNGLVENNVILALHETADAAIENNYARDSKILHNTIFYRKDLSHAVNWGIEYRFGPTSVLIQNNLSNLPIHHRSPFSSEEVVIKGNMTNAQAWWFQGVFKEDVHLAPGANAIDAGVRLSGVHWDYDDVLRPIGDAPDVGADEYEGSVMLQNHLNGIH